MLKKYIDENILLLYSLHMIQLSSPFSLLLYQSRKVQKYESTKVQKYESTKSTKGTRGESGCRP